MSMKNKSLTFTPPALPSTRFSTLPLMKTATISQPHLSAFSSRAATRLFPSDGPRVRHDIISSTSVERRARSTCGADVMLESAGAASDDNQNADYAIDTITSQDPPPALPELCARIHEKLEIFLKAEPKNERVKAVQAQTRISLGVIEEALERYSLDELSLSYNGGKDCLVLLILYLAALHKHTTKSRHTNNRATNHTSSSLPDKLRGVYILSLHPFQEVDDFVTRTSRTYHLSLSRYAKPMREAFTDYLSDHPSVRAIFVGTRRTDPHGAALTHFDMTDGGWPSFMRIHPVIDWHYVEIWTFIRELGVEYCGLYDLGYTSLGGRGDTHPNPALKLGGDAEGFRPAYELVGDEEERLGRA